MDWPIPTLADVLDARRRIAPHLAPTPLYGYPDLDQLVGTETLVKHENHLPVGRGGVNLVSQLPPAERDRGIIAASTGNHGQSLAYAGRLFRVPVTICVPENANPVKVASMRALGPDFDAARQRCEALAGSTAAATSTRATSRCSSLAWARSI